MQRNPRNLIPPLFGVACLIGFLISATVGVIVCIGGGALSGVLWSYFSGPRSRTQESGRTP